MKPEEYSRMHALESEYWWFAGRRAIIGSLLSRVHKPKSIEDQSANVGLSLLDIGCGTGANLPLLRSRTGRLGHVAAVDFSPHALHFARNELRGTAGLNGVAPLTLSQADAIALPFRSTSFDAVTMLDVLEHLDDENAALTEVRRVLRPGGAFVFSVPAYQKLWSAHDDALHHFRRYEYQSLGEVLRLNGLEPEILSFAMSLMPPFAWLWRRVILPFRPKRPADAKRHSEGAVLPQIPAVLNRALIAYLAMEGRFILRSRIHFGTSLVGIARRV